jgi:hypothetical protein
MVDMVWDVLEKIACHLTGLDRQHWILLSVVALVVGVVCLRGFGSRTNY